jgi:DNA repair exonuclease SbcCD nuclease subunit
VSKLRQKLSQLDKDKILIMHQGLQSSNSGEYYQDHSALSLEDIKDFRVISGHYHTRQTIGNFDYIGNPYTLNFGEANDPEKGFQVLHSNGHLEFIPTNLRKHVIITHNIVNNDTEWSSGPAYAGGGRNDLIWVKVLGTKQQLSKFNKDAWLKDSGIPNNVKLSLLPTDEESRYSQKAQNLSQKELFDDIISSKNIDKLTQKRLKTLWRCLCE